MVQASAADLGISMGDAGRIDVDSPLWDQTTFIGLIKMALIPNSVGIDSQFCSMVRTFPSLCLDVKPSERPQLHCHSAASQTAGRIIKTIKEPTHLQPPSTTYRQKLPPFQVDDYREGREPEGTTREQVVGAMALYR